MKLEPAIKRSEVEKVEKSDKGSEKNVKVFIKNSPILPQNALENSIPAIMAGYPENSLKYK